MRTQEEIDAKIRELEATAKTFPVVTNAITVLNTYQQLDRREIRVEIASLGSRFHAYDKILTNSEAKPADRSAAKLARLIAMCRASAILWLMGKVDTIVKQEKSGATVSLWD